MDRTLFQRVRDGEEMSHPPQLTPEMLEIIRQLTLIEARRESALKTKMGATTSNRDNDKETS